MNLPTNIFNLIKDFLKIPIKKSLNINQIKEIQKYRKEWFHKLKSNNKKVRCCKTLKNTKRCTKTFSLNNKNYVLYCNFCII